jgi:hypothetical protein
MDFKIVNPSNGRSGGVILFWKKEVMIQQIFSAPNYIDVRVVESANKVWRLIGLYGEPRWQDKYKTWDKMRELKAQYDLPWAIIGDFNEIMFSYEKDGGNPRPEPFIQAFRDALDDCELEDLGFSGDPFTWKRGRIRERLDRVATNNAWNIMHPGALVKHLGYAHSDHRPILLDTEHAVMHGQRNSNSRKFEAKWFKEKDFRDVVQKAWVDASVAVSDGGILAKLGHLHGALHDWDDSVLKN